MLTRPITKLWLILPVFFTSLLVLQAQNDCNCNERIVVQVNAQCRYVLRKADLGIKNCPDTYISVQDNKAQNRDTIDAPGTYVYGLYQNDGRLVCQGNVIAMAPSGPVLDSVKYSQDTLSFQSLEQVFNKANTTGVPGSNLSLGNSNIRLTYDGRFVDLVKDEVPNLGIPFFSMGCQTPCGITLSFSDEWVYSACRDAQISNLYATIRRSWIARDCQGRTKSSVQFIHFKNPEKLDFVWNLSRSNQRELTLYYGECSLSPNSSVLDQIFPVATQKQIAVPLSGLKISQAIQEIPDTACGGKGIKIIRNYLIYDECRNRVIDTFKVILAPGKVNTNWITVPSDTLVFTAVPKACKIGLPVKSKEKLLEILQAKMNLACKERYFDWMLERPLPNNPDQWITISPLSRDSLFLTLGYARITLTVLDSCQNLYNKRLYILVKDSSRFEFNCPKPFDGTFELKQGQPYFRVSGLNSLPKTPQCRTYSQTYRRVIAADCLTRFLLNREYDLDQDGDVMEHFSLIAEGEFAGKYYSPWVSFMEAFVCDEGSSVHYEQKTTAIEEDLESVCKSYFNISKLKPLTFSFPDTTLKVGSSTCIPLQMIGLRNILGIGLDARYNPSILRFDSIVSYSGGPAVGNFGFPLAGGNPAGRLRLSWVVPSLIPFSLPDNSTLFEVCFTALAQGESPLWIDSTSVQFEVIDQNGVNLKATTRVGKVKVVNKNDFQKPIQQIQDTPPLTGSIIGDKRIPDVRVFPNPSTGVINVAFSEAYLPEGMVRIKDAQGRVLAAQTIRQNQMQMNLENVPNGILFVEFSTTAKNWVEKIVLLQH